MRRCFSAAVLSTAIWPLISCGTATRKAAPLPESQQVIGEGIKQLYMAASTAKPRSAEQQKLIEKMAATASNGKELLLAMRAAVGVFPAEPDGQTIEARVRATATLKMMQVGTLDQLTDYATQYSVDPSRARAYVERMFELGADASDPRAWYRIRSVAGRLKLSDLQLRAEAKGNELAASR
jgi:hypothetical protein